MHIRNISFHRIVAAVLSLLDIDIDMLGIKNETACMKVTPTLAVAPLAHGDDMRWNPNDDAC